MMRAHMQEVTSTAASSPAAPTTQEERYVKVASRFFRVDPAACDGGDAMTRRLHNHYLGSCFLCKMNIPCNRDTFMYRGDAAFCSEECRQEQMDMDEALDAVARQHRRLSLPQHKPSSAELAVVTRPAMMHRRRPTIADLAALTPVAAS